MFQQAVSRQLVSDVEIGSYLSGGMDSGSITAIAAKNFPYLKSFTCGFDLSSASGIELSFDERVKAEAMSAKFKTEHYEMVLKAGDMERCLSSVVRHLEEPRIGKAIQIFMLLNWQVSLSKLFYQAGVMSFLEDTLGDTIEVHPQVILKNMWMSTIFIGEALIPNTQISKNFRTYLV